MAKSKIVSIKSANKNKKTVKPPKEKDKKKRKKDMASLSPRARKKEKRKRFIIIIIVILLAIFGGYSIYKIGVLQVQKHNLDDENMDLKREKALLEEELKNVQNLEYIEEEAREKLNLILPGEIIYKFSDDENGK